MERFRKLWGRKYDYQYRTDKKAARTWKKRAKLARKLHGRRAKLFTNKRYKEKIELRKNININKETTDKHKNNDSIPDGAVPAYLLDREGVSRSKVLSNTIKQIPSHSNTQKSNESILNLRHTFYNELC